MDSAEAGWGIKKLAKEYTTTTSNEKKIKGKKVRITNFTYLILGFLDATIGLEKAELDWVGMHLSHTSNAAARVL